LSLDPLSKMLRINVCKTVLTVVGVIYGLLLQRQNLNFKLENIMLRTSFGLYRNGTKLLCS